MTIARVTTTVSGNTSLPSLDYAALVAAGRVVPEFLERDLVADWCFDQDSDASLRSKINSALLDASGKSIQHESNASGAYMLMNAGLNGMATPLADAREWLYAGIWNYRDPDPAGSIQVLAGSAGGTSGEGGEFLFVAPDGDIRVNVRGYGAQLQVQDTAVAAAGITDNTWFFAAVSSRIASGDASEHTLLLGSASGSVTVTGSGTKTLSTTSRAMALGNAYNAPDGTYTAMPIRCARFLCANRPADTGELAAMYARAKIAATRRGVTVV